jgi:AAA domain-containing protein/CHC2-type zinc finger protein
MTAAFDNWVKLAREIPIENEIARRGIKLRKQGAEFIGPCPKCGGVDRFSVNVAKRCWNCRQCKKETDTGDVIGLVRWWDDCDFKTACTTLNNGEPPPKPNGKHSAAEPKKIVAAKFPYYDASGALRFVTERVEFQNPDGTYLTTKEGKRRKSFRQRRPDPDRPRSWIWNVAGVPALPYRLPELVEAVGNGLTILIVEGEAKVDLLRSWNVPATCCAGGAKKWRAEHSAYLRGADVAILPDNDPIGFEHADIVARALVGIAKRVRRLLLPDLPPKGDVFDWEEAGGTRERLDELISKAPNWNADATADATPERPEGRIELRTHRDRNISSRKWIAKRLIPKEGVGLISGQWGTGKTSIALDLAAALRVGGTFAGLPIRQQGVTLFFALEGIEIVASSLEAISREKHDGKRIGIYYIDEPITLLDKKGVERAIAIAREAAARAERDDELPLTMIVFDTVMRAAGYAGEGAEQDNVIGAQLLQAFSRIKNATGALVVGLDHYGKNVSTGTRGGSAKEDSADFVLALLGDRDTSGKVSNRRLALRKLRGGAAGVEHPFDIKVVDIGLDEDGDPDTGAVIDWSYTPPPIHRHTVGDRDATTIRNIVADLINDGSCEDRTPIAGMPSVRCIKVEDVRAEFYRRYVVTGDSDPNKVQRAKIKAAQRAFHNATDKTIKVRDGWCWLIT